MTLTAGRFIRQTWWWPLGVCAAVLALERTEPLRLLEARTLDWRTRYRALFQPPPDPRIRIVLFEDSTEASVAPWPVNRAWHGRLTRLLALERTAVVAWDVILDAARADGGDEAMARDTRRAIEAGTRVVVGAATSRTSDAASPTEDEATQPLARVEGDRGSVHGAERALLPFAGLRAACRWGLVDAPRGPDGIIREVPLAVRVGGRIYPAFALQTLMEYLGVPPDEVGVRLGEAVEFAARGRTWRIPIDRRGWFLLNYRYDQTERHSDFPTHSYLELLVKINDHRVEQRPGAPLPPDLAGRIVLVGQTVTGKADAGPTPLGAFSPLVLVHANMLNNMLAGDYARRTPGWLGWGLVLFLAYAGVANLAHRSVFVAVGGLMLSVVVYALLALWLWVHGSWWLPVAGPLLGLTGAQSLVIIRRLREEQRAQREIKSMFGTYVSPRLVEQLVAAGEPPQLGGCETAITAYFSDIQGFTGIAEHLSPGRLVGLINEYLSVCAGVVQEEGGTVDKYVGDAVVAMFGAPVTQPDHAWRACRAALRVQQRLGELRAKWRDEGERWPPAVATMRTRIGLNTGRCVVGNMGGSARFNYTMMGDEVNLASRLESGAKHWGARILVSESTRADCVRHGGDRAVFRPLGRVMVRGRTQPVPIHELVGFGEQLAPAARECLELFGRGLACFGARDWAGASAWFTRSAALEPELTAQIEAAAVNPSRFYLELCARHACQPPPAGWDGAVVLSEK